MSMPKASCQGRQCFPMCFKSRNASSAGGFGQTSPVLRVGEPGAKSCARCPPDTHQRGGGQQPHTHRRADGNPLVGAAGGLAGCICR